MTATIIPFSGITRLDLPADQVLERSAGKLAGVVVIGFDHNGELYAASSYADGGTVMWLLEACKQRLLDSH